MNNIQKAHASYLAKSLKLLPYVLSDEEFKDIGVGLDIKDIVREIVAEDGPYNENELRYIIKAVGNIAPEKDFDKYGDIWSQDTVNAYAKHIHNELYKYKPEAKEIDPAIDPSQNHIGPMAQDIEKVNPSCVVETPDGVKTVDTGRLALMNAGVIADLAREIQELKHANI